MVHKINKDRLDDFLRALSRGRKVFALEQVQVGEGVERREQYRLVSAEEWIPGKHTLGAFRQVEPLKALVFRPRELLGSLGGDAPGADIPERIVIGAKNCVVAALRIHDHVFLNTEPVDPSYKEAREKTIIVSCDCTDASGVFLPGSQGTAVPQNRFRYQSFADRSRLRGRSRKRTGQTIAEEG